jgi:hypothetical protein
MNITRRDFLATGAVTPAVAQTGSSAAPVLPAWTARWIWYPENRTLPGTFVLFRREYTITGAAPVEAQAWVTGQSKYALFLNGKMISRGPAPCDPRYWDADPVDLAPHLKPGVNVLAAIVCIYGYGEGTWIPPSPPGSGNYGQGLLFEAPSLGWRSDTSWQAHRSRSWKAGSPPRWYLRALQEQFDMRQWPEGWLSPGYRGPGWKAARESSTPPGQPNLTERPRGGAPPGWTLQPRSVPPLVETRVPAMRIIESGWVDWNIAPEEYFECFPDGAFTETRTGADGKFPFLVPATGKRSFAVTCEFGEMQVGYPYVRLRAPAGAIVEILFVEKQEPGKLLLRTHPRFGQWVRLITREGMNEFEAFEYEGMKQMQLLVRNAQRPVEILEAGVTAKRYPWPHECDLRISDAAVQRACDASLRTHHLTALDTVVDNQIRERQQYAGDLDHPKLASYYAHGEYRQAARMFRTYTQGQNREGWFMDCFPANDRCQRLYQKHLGLTEWGPILDHSLQLGIALADHYLFTADRGLLEEVYPRLEKFDAFLRSHLEGDGLLPVEPWTWNSVWIDHIGYRVEQDKHAALNLYYAGFLQAMQRMAGWLGRTSDARAVAAQIIERVRASYWSPELRVFVDNLPRLARDGGPRLHARTLSMGLLFGAAPDEAPSVELLESMRNVGMNYPLNEIWRLWALGRAGRATAIVRELRERWVNLPSVLETGTYAEFWDPKPSSSGNVWCQSNPVPLIAAYQILLGLRPVAPGFRQYEVRPQPAGIASLSATVHTVPGPITLQITSGSGGYQVRWTAPPRAMGVLVVPDGARVSGLPAGVGFEPGRDPRTRRALMPTSAKEQEWLFDVQSA